MTRRGWRGVGHAVMLALLVVYSLFPIYFMLVQSLKTPQEDVFGHPLIVLHPTLDNFRELFGEAPEQGGIISRSLLPAYPFVEWLENTAIVFAGSLALTLAVSIMAGYALGRLRPPGWRWWRRVLFATYAIPHTILILRKLARRRCTKQPAPVDPRRPGKIGRNDPCPCGSGQKYKRCCARN